MWYKLSGRTNMAVWITLTGLIVTTIVNIVFMPRFSYWASAFAHLSSYLVMFILSAWLGQKYYPIPYKWGRLMAFFGLMGVAYASMLGISALSGGISGLSPVAFRLILNTVITAAYAGAAWVLLRHRPVPAA
jgi:O-antigen/teichoic acid export membrane protein